jgi:hypothetical protein
MVELPRRHGAFEKTAQGAAHTDLYLGDDQAGVGAFCLTPAEVDVIDADNLAAMNVNDLLVDDIFPQQQVILEGFQGLERRTVDEDKRTAGVGPDMLDIDETSSQPGFEHEACHLPGICACAYGNVGKRPAQVAALVPHRRTLQQGETGFGQSVGMHGGVTVSGIRLMVSYLRASPLMYLEMADVQNAGLADVSEMHVAVIGFVDRVFRLDDGRAAWIGQRIRACGPDGRLTLAFDRRRLRLKTFRKSLLLVLFELGDGGHIDLRTACGAEDED